MRPPGRSLRLLLPWCALLAGLNAEAAVVSVKLVTGTDVDTGSQASFSVRLNGALGDVCLAGRIDGPRPGDTYVLSSTGCTFGDDGLSSFTIQRTWLEDGTYKGTDGGAWHVVEASVLVAPDAWSIWALSHGSRDAWIAGSTVHDPKTWLPVAPTPAVPTVPPLPLTPPPVKGWAVPVQVEQIATVAAYASVIGATGAPLATRMLLLVQECRLHVDGDNTLPFLLHPTQMEVWGTAAGGAVLGNTVIAVAFLILHGAVVAFSDAVVYPSTVDLYGTALFPALPYIVYYVLYQGAVAGAWKLCFRGSSAGEALMGGAGLLLCAAVPVFLAFHHHRRQAAASAFAEDERTTPQTAEAFLLGQGEWVNRRRDMDFVGRWLPSLHPYRGRANHWHPVVQFASMFAAGTLWGLRVETYDGCGHVKVAGAALVAIVLAADVYARPYARPRDAVLSSCYHVLTAAALAVMAAAYYGQDPDHALFRWVHMLLLACVGLLVIKVLLDLACEVYVFLRARRARLQADVSARLDSARRRRSSTGHVPCVERQQPPPPPPPQPYETLADSLRQQTPPQPPPPPPPPQPPHYQLPPRAFTPVGDVSSVGLPSTRPMSVEGASGLREAVLHMHHEQSKAAAGRGGGSRASTTSADGAAPGAHFNNPLEALAFVRQSNNFIHDAVEAARARRARHSSNASVSSGGTSGRRGSGMHLSARSSDPMSVRRVIKAKRERAATTRSTIERVIRPTQAVTGEPDEEAHVRRANSMHLPRRGSLHSTRGGAPGHYHGVNLLTDFELEVAPEQW